MTDNEINVAIAEACGWTFFCVNAFNEHVYHGPNGEVATSPDSDDDYQLPHYAGDLNAMHEAEKNLDFLQIVDYVNTLFRKFDEGEGWEDSSTHLVFFPFICAPARQRAEAFLRVTGRWIETPDRITEAPKGTI